MKRTEAQFERDRNKAVCSCGTFYDRYGCHNASYCKASPYYTARPFTHDLHPTLGEAMLVQTQLEHRLEQPDALVLPVDSYQPDKRPAQLAPEHWLWKLENELYDWLWSWWL